MLLVILALLLFFVTALAGRLWCGYACPQTVWTEVFLWMERWTEGDRPGRMKLDAGPWTREKVLRKGAKHFLWLVFALWTGFTFVGFFTPITGLGARVWPFDWNGWEVRSEEHTSELQSLMRISYAVFCLKKKKSK